MGELKTLNPSPFGRQLIRSYKIGYLHMLRYAEDFTDEEARIAPAGHMPMTWYVAHLMCAHDHFLKLFVSTEGGLDDAFVASYAGYCGEVNFQQSPPFSELMEQYRGMHQRVCDFLATLSPDDLDREPNGQAAHPTFERLGSALTVISFHDGYHGGQLSLLRDALGKPNLSDDVELAAIA